MYETLGNIGDFLGGIGVVVTLIYLALQIRQNTKSGRANSYQAVIGSISNWSASIGQNPQVAALFRKGVEDGLANLDKDERVQFSMLIVGIFRHFENLHYQYLSGEVTDEAWEGWPSRIFGLLVQPGAKEVWISQQNGFSKRFLNFVEDGITAGQKMILPWLSM